MENEVNNNVDTNVDNTLPETTSNFDTNSTPEPTPEEVFTTESNETLDTNPTLQPEAPTQVEQSYNNVAPMAEPPKKSKKGLGIGVIILIAVLAVALIGGTTYYFMSSTPKAMYKTLIKNAFKEVNNAIEDYDKRKEKFEYKNKALVLEAQISGDTNISSVKEQLDKYNINLKDYTLGGKIGLDAKNKELLGGITLKGVKEELGVDLYIKDNKLYVVSDLLEQPIIVEMDEDSATKLEQDMAEISESYDEAVKSVEELMSQIGESSISADDAKYIVNTVRDALIDSLDEKKMKKEDTSIEVDGKTVKVTRVRYELDKENVKNTVKTVCEKLAGDDKFLGIIAKASQQDKGTIKDAINEVKDSAKDIEVEKDTYINLYVKGLTHEFAGLSVEVKGKEVVTYYKNKTQTELTLYIDALNEYAEEKRKVSLLVTEEKKTTTISAKYNGKEVVYIKMNTSDEDALDITEYRVQYEDFKVSGYLYIKLEETKSQIKLTGKAKVEYNGEFVSAEATISLNSRDKLFDKDLSNAIDIESVDGNKLIERIEERITKDEALKKAYESIEEDFKDQVNENTNGSGKSTIVSKDAKTLSCTDTSDSFKQKTILAINDKTKKIERAQIVYSAKVADLDETEIKNSSCNTFKAATDEILDCEESTVDGILTITIDYDTKVVQESFEDGNIEVTAESIKKMYLDQDMTCSLD